MIDYGSMSNEELLEHAEKILAVLAGRGITAKAVLGADGQSAVGFAERTDT